MNNSKDTYNLQAVSYTLLATGKGNKGIANESKKDTEDSSTK